MTGILRRGAAIGLSVLLLAGPVGSLASAAQAAPPLASAALAAPGSALAVPAQAAPAAAPALVVPAQPAPAPAAGTPAAEPAGASTSAPSPSYALEPDPFALTISPTRLVVDPAHLNTVQKIQVINRGQASATVTVQKRDFVPAPDGSLTYRTDAPYAASGWVTITPASFTVAPGATQIVSATVHTPSAPEPGDHQVALVFLVPAGKTSANIRINRGIATPLYLTVPGATSNDATISEVSAPGFAQRGPVTLTAKVHNTGSVHRDFRGATSLTVSGAGTAKAFPDFTVLRDSVREISTTWDPPLLCICHPRVQFANADGAVQSSSVRVIMFPWLLFVLLLAALGMLVLAVRGARRGYRRSIRKAAAAMNQPLPSGNV